MRRTSFNQNLMADRCIQQWYNTYVLKLPVLSDMSYANAGSVVHKVLEKYYSNKEISIDELKLHFNLLWGRFKLQDSILKEKKDSYWLMILNGKQLNLDLTSQELKIYYPDVVGYIDGVDTKNHEIIDWKTSTRSEDNEEEYTLQMKFYAWLYFRKFNVIPKKCTVYYLKKTGTNGELSIIPTQQDLIMMEDWHHEVQKKIQNALDNKEIIKCTDEGKQCNYFCPYKNLCFMTENKIKYTLHMVKDYIFVDGSITELLNRGLNKKFSYELKNAYFMKKHNPRISTTVRFWNSSRRTLPIGFLRGLIKTLSDYTQYKNKELELNIVDNRQKFKYDVKMPDNFLNGKKLRDYQSEAVDKFTAEKVGILQVGTGGGKTEIAIETIRRLKTRTLFIVDKIELMRQTKKRIEDSLGIDVGEIGGGKNIQCEVTVATVQTLTKHLAKYAKYLNSVEFAIFDETHKVAANSYWKLSHYLINTQYRMGLSGTAFRDDGNDMKINAVTGYIIYDLSAKVLIERGWLIPPKIIFIKDYMSDEYIEELNRESSSGLINETENYMNYYKNFIQDNGERNNYILGITQKHLNRKILILTKLIEHGSYLAELLNGKHLYGNTPKEERKQIMDEFANGKLNVLVSTISIFSEGIDIPSLDVVINAAGNKGDVKTIQILGRVLRKLEGKKNAYYYDFIDESGFMKAASFSRRRALKKEGHNVEIKNGETITFSSNNTQMQEEGDTANNESR